MNMVLFLISMLLPTAAGYVLVIGEEAFSPVERTIYSFTLGTGLLSFYLYGLLLLELLFSFWSLLPFFTLFLIIASFRWRAIIERRSCSARISFPDYSAAKKSIYYLLLILIVWKVLFIVFIICSGPTMFSDSYTTWNYKAKIIYYMQSANMSPGGGIFQGPFTHYPLHLPIMRAWIAFCIGQWDETFVNLHSVILFICLLGLVYEFLKRRAGAIRALIIIWVLTGIPVLINNVLSGYADFAVGYLFLASMVLLHYWHITGKKRFLVFTGMLVSVAMFTKLEGLAIVFPALLITFFICLLSPRYSWKRILNSLGLFVISSSLIVFWLIKSQALNALMAISGINNSAVRFHPEGIRQLVEMLFVYRSHNLFWFGISFIFVLKWRAALRPEVRFFLIPSVLSFCAVLFVFLFTQNIQWLMDGTSINRTMLVVIPLLTLAGGLLFVPERSSDAEDGLKLYSTSS